MTFTETTIDPKNPVNVQRWVDETGKWFLCIERVFFGYRVQLQRDMKPMSEDVDVVLDYCAGAHLEWVEALVTVLRRSLRLIAPSINSSQLYQMYPRYTMRPMLRDAACWATLCRLGEVDPSLPVEEIGDVNFDKKRAAAIQIYLFQIQSGIDREYAHQTLNVLSSY